MHNQEGETSGTFVPPGRSAMPKPLNRMSEAEFEAAFAVGDQNACRDYLVARRWPEGVRCPRCNNSRVWTLSRRFQWSCKECSSQGYNFSEKVGTIFEGTKVP